MNKFNLTIITVVKNDEKNIKNDSSINNQKNIEFEYIIVDGGSTDKIKIIKKFKKFIKVIISRKIKEFICNEQGYHKRK